MPRNPSSQESTPALTDASSRSSQDSATHSPRPTQAYGLPPHGRAAIYHPRGNGHSLPLAGPSTGEPPHIQWCSSQGNGFSGPTCRPHRRRQSPPQGHRSYHNRTLPSHYPLNAMVGNPATSTSTGTFDVAGADERPSDSARAHRYAQSSLRNHPTGRPRAVATVADPGNNLSSNPDTRGAQIRSSTEAARTHAGIPGIQQTIATPGWAPPTLHPSAHFASFQHIAEPECDQSHDVFGAQDDDDVAMAALVNYQLHNTNASEPQASNAAPFVDSHDHNVIRGMGSQGHIVPGSTNVLAPASPAPHDSHPHAFRAIHPQVYRATVAADTDLEGGTGTADTPVHNVARPRNAEHQASLADSPPEPRISAFAQLSGCTRKIAVLILRSFRTVSDEAVYHARRLMMAVFGPNPRDVSEFCQRYYWRGVSKAEGQHYLRRAQGDMAMACLLFEREEPTGTPSRRNAPHIQGWF